jgi:hypothetical protein
LFLHGAAPARTIERLRSFDALLARLGRGPGKLDWMFASSIDPLMRPLDLSGLGRKADVLDQRSTGTALAAPSHSRMRNRGETSAGQSLIDPAPVRFKHDSAEVSAMLRSYLPVSETEVRTAADPRAAGNRDVPEPALAARPQTETIRHTAPILGDRQTPNDVSSGSLAAQLELSRIENAGGRPERHSFAHANRSAASPANLVSPEAATEWLRNRAAAAGAFTIADSPVVRETNEKIDRILQRTLAEAHEPVASTSNNPVPTDAIARLSHTLEVLRTTPRDRSIRTLHQVESAPRRTHLQDSDREHLPASQLSVASNELGLRGLIARMTRSNGELNVTRPAARQSSEELADRLGAVLKEEAQREGIDLEDIER